MFLSTQLSYATHSKIARRSTANIYVIGKQMQIDSTKAESRNLDHFTQIVNGLESNERY